MAIYHCSVKTISRSQGRSAKAAIAYRTAEKIVDYETGQTYDYQQKQGVLHSEIVLPKEAPEWANDREQLWNEIEKREVRKNATLAREFEIALPSELTREQQKALAINFAKEIVNRHQCIADVAIHAPSREGDQRNVHAHILCSTRRLSAEGFTQKTRELDVRNSGEIQHWRERFAQLQNQHLRQQGHTVRVDHRSLKDQGIDRAPTQHYGAKAIGYERRTGEKSQRRITLEQKIQQKEQDQVQLQKVEQEIIQEKKELNQWEKVQKNLPAEFLERGLAQARRGFEAYKQQKQYEQAKEQVKAQYQQYKETQQKKQSEEQKQRLERPPPQQGRTQGRGRGRGGRGL